MHDKHQGHPECCPRCESEDIIAHLGIAECYECYYKWSYTQDNNHNDAKAETK